MQQTTPLTNLVRLTAPAAAPIRVVAGPSRSASNANALRGLHLSLVLAQENTFKLSHPRMPRGMQGPFAAFSSRHRSLASPTPGQQP
jgi:hypothetical protein